MIRKDIMMKRAAGISVILFLLLSLNAKGQITGAVIKSTDYNVGTTLTADTTGSPESGNHVDYEWFYSPSTSFGTTLTYNLASSDQGKSIYIIAYEKNGTDDVIRSFSSSTITVNSYPIASYVGISGTTRSGMILRGSYVYSDADSDPESGTAFQWYRGTSPGGAGQTAIGSAVSASYMLTNSDIGSYIGFSVTPSSSAGSVPGSQATTAVWTGPIIANSAPVASSVNILGNLSVNNTLIGTYTYSDAEGNAEGTSSYQWYTATSSGGAGQTPISLATQISYQLTNAESGKYIGFSVTPSAITGTTPGTPVISLWEGPVINNPPVASSLSITGSLNVNGVLTGHYTYSDSEGDIESGSSYEWLSSTTSGGTYTAIPGETGISHQITMSEQGLYFKFSVTPGAATGTTTGTKVISSSYIGPANSQPYADGVLVSGTTFVGSVLTGVYSYHDPDSDPEGTSLYQWYRGPDPIASATALTYTLVTSDVDQNITFKVTPVSAGSVIPNTGLLVASAAVGPVTDPTSTPPQATNLCIDGTRTTGLQLTGKYEYMNKYDEENSKYLWFRQKTLLKSGTGTSNIKYTLVADDIDKDIIFAVIPRNKRGELGDTAFSISLARFDMPRDVFSVADTGQTLLATPMGGVFSGPGVTNGLFYPVTAGIAGSPYTIQYVLNVGTTTTCFQKAFTSFQVKPVVVYFEGIKSKYCDNNLPATVYVRNLPIGSTIKIFSITDAASNLTEINDTTAVFDPDQMQSGDKKDTIYYTYSDGTTVIRIKQALVIDHIGVITMGGLAPGSQICSNTTPFEIYPSRVGGVFTGPVLAGKFDPSLVTAMGDTTVKYVYTSTTGCTATVIIPVTVNASPIVSFAPADSCITSSMDTTRFLNYTVSPDPVKTWFWEFTDGANVIPSYEQEASYLYKTGGLHKIALSATTIKDCKTYKEITVDLGVKPKAGFTWKNECFHSGDSLLLKDNTTSASVIVSRSWNFYDGDSLHTLMTFKYPQKSTGFLKVQYIVKTAYRGCHDTITRNIFIRPSVTLNPAIPYEETFEGGNGGWVKDYNNTNEWTFGAPIRTDIKKAYSGTNVWYTGINYSIQDTAFYSIISPCFDFTSIERPMISMWLWKRFDRDRNGASLQYKIGDDGSWEYTGTIEDEGIKWFNSALIGKPGGNLLGWTTKQSPDTSWVQSRHGIDMLRGQKDVKFRIVYASDGSSKNNDGIAVDDIWIGERSRTVLFEQFTNSSNIANKDADIVVDTIMAHASKDVINIRYHTNFPGYDPFNAENQADVSARVLYYGLTETPYSFVDGGFNSSENDYAGLYDYNLATPDTNAVRRRSLVDPLFRISVTPNVSGGILTVNGKITALGKVDAENLTLYIAVTEKENTDHTGANGVKIFYNVFRKLMPDGGGINLKKSWIKDEEFTIPAQSWIIQKIKNSSDIEVVAFLQNNITKEVYQAASQVKLNIVTGIENHFTGSSKSFSLYPNPAVNKLTIGFSEPLAGDSDIKIYDLQGLLISAYKAGSGISEYAIDNLKLKSGIYLVRVSRGGIDLGFRKLIITVN